MDFFLYMDHKSFLHRLDPRTKLLILGQTFIIALMFISIPVLLGLTALVLLYGFAGGTLSNLKRIKMVLIMIALFSIVIWSLMKGGPTRIWGPLTLEGLQFGIANAIRFDVMIIAGMIFLSSTKIEEIALGLVRLKIPYRGAFAFTTAIRLVPSIVDTAHTIIQAQKSRGLDLDSGNFFQRLRKYIPLLVPTIISVIRGTGVFAMALESKGFGYDAGRTYYLDIAITAKDIWLMISTSILLILAIGIKVFLVA